MAVFEDLSGKRFGRLVVVCRGEVPEGSRDRKPRWVVQCDCGTSKTVRAGVLKKGSCRSCGCLQIELTVARSVTHQMAGTLTHNSWHCMKSRCGNHNHENYPRYGARGIRVCDRWLVFENFLSDMGERPGKEFTIERRDLNGDYCPDNCYWATMGEQAKNRSSNRYLEYDGRRMTLEDWSREIGITPTSLSERISRGWTEDQIFGGAPRKRKRKA